VKGGEMTQTLYAHMNKKKDTYEIQTIIQKFFKNLYSCKLEVEEEIDIS
jgi:hypothetical protein